MLSFHRIWIIITALGAVFAFAACSATPTPTPSITPTPMPTSRFSTHVGPVVRETLPPTWTSTPTPTASRTSTPTPITPTATATPVPDLASLCDSFQFINSVADGHAFQWSDTIQMIYGTPLTTVRDPDTGALVPLTIRFLATHTATGENLGVQMDGGQVFGMELSVDQLPHPGAYTWRLAVSGDGIADQCVHTGSFFVYPPPISTVEATPEATSELTSEPRS